MAKRKEVEQDPTKPFVPRTLQAAIEHFADKDVAHGYAVAMRWPDGIHCTFCDSPDWSYISTRRIWKCKNKDCRKQFSFRIGTIFEDSPISMSKWFVAIWMLVNCKNGVSSYELHRAIGVTQKTAWFMLHRVRRAIKAKSFNKKLAGGGPLFDVGIYSLNACRYLTGEEPEHIAANASVIDHDGRFNYDGRRAHNCAWLRTKGSLRRISDCAGTLETVRLPMVVKGTGVSKVRIMGEMKLRRTSR